LALCKGRLVPGRCFGSKTAWQEAHPGQLAWFNARVFCRTAGQIWGGDLDPSKDKAKLRAVARRLRIRLYVLKERDDGSFESVVLTHRQVAERAIWNTSSRAAQNGPFSHTR
jgi:hypothetical protein